MATGIVTLGIPGGITEFVTGGLHPGNPGVAAARIFTATVLERMQSTQEEAMMDTGNVQPISASLDSFGQAVETWTNGTALACGLDMTPGSERREADMTLVEYDAIVRLPIGTTVDMRDRFRVTKRFGVTLGTALVFEIVGPIRRGPSGIRLLLRRVET